MLTVILVGGIFAGQASTAGAADGSGHPADILQHNPQVLAPDRALDIQPGSVRVEPFFTAPQLHAQTLALDVTLIPGGVPEIRQTISLSSLWTKQGQPALPESLEVSVTAAEYLTVLDVVEASVNLDVDGRPPARSGQAWRCSYDTRLTLMDHESVRPTLWDLHLLTPDHHERWLALADPSTGPFRALFTDPGAAQSFLGWLRATAATHAGRYQLGLFEADQDAPVSKLPADRDIALSFKPALAAELRYLTIGRLGDN